MVVGYKFLKICHKTLQLKSCKHFLVLLNFN
jgi:hypothetical protein